MSEGSMSPDLDITPGRLTLGVNHVFGAEFQGGTSDSLPGTAYIIP